MHEPLRRIYGNTFKYTATAVYAAAYRHYLDAFVATMDPLTGLSPDGQVPLLYKDFAQAQRDRADPFRNKPPPNPKTNPPIRYLYDLYIREHGRQGRAYLPFEEFTALHHAHGLIPATVIADELAHWAKVDKEARRQREAEIEAYNAHTDYAQRAELESIWRKPVPKVPRHHS